MLDKNGDPVENGVIGAVQIQDLHIFGIQCITIAKAVS